MRYIGSGDPWDRDRIEQVHTSLLYHWTEHGFGWRAAIEKGSGSYIGFIGLNFTGPEAIEIAEEEVEIGWWLTPSRWGEGIATEGALALRDEGFARVGLERIIGRHHADNPASGRIMEKLGMGFEREATGRYGQTVRIYALDRLTWSGL